MARIRPVLRALVRAFRRHIRSLGSFATNNFFLVSLIMFIQQPPSGTLIYGLMALVLFFPLSSDPLRVIPPARLALWPLERNERRLLRWVSPWLNPVTWILAVLVVRGSMTFGAFAVLGAMFAAGFVAPALTVGTRGHVRMPLPRFPGKLGVLVRKNLREMLASLDFFLALLLSLLTLGGRIAHLLPTEGHVPMTFLIVLALSSYAQCLFGLDGPGGMARYALLPLRGWQLLAAKDAAFLLIATVLTLPAAPLSGLAGAFAALALGHLPSVYNRVEQRRWRFFSGASLANGIAQAILIGAAAVNTAEHPAALLPCAALWAVSLGWFGRKLESQAG